MAIIQSCCCWQSVRKGSYASAIYTLSYFVLTCYIMGVTIHNDLEYYWEKNNATISKPRNASFLEPQEISPVTMCYYLVVFMLAVLGIFTSLMLLIGLYFEIRWLLLPWLAIVLISSFVDVTHSIYWLTRDDPNFNPLTAIFFTIELFVFFINLYTLLCVFSQYQEYRAGRGTAAYDTLQETIRRREQTPTLSVRCSQQHATGTSYLTTTASQSAKDFFCTAACECPQSTTIVLDNIKSRRVQFTANEGFAAPASKLPIHRNSKITQVDEEDDDYGESRTDYLWCAAPDERILICDIPSTHYRDVQEVQASKKRVSIIDSPSKSADKHSKKSKLSNAENE